MDSIVYCPRCGAVMERRFTEGRERDVCPNCGLVFYRNPVPAVGVVVVLDDRVVLVRRKFEPQAGFWALPAGYMELGESAEEAAIRECHEETGLLVQIDHLLGVYSFGAGDQSGLVIIYAATAVGGELQAGDDAVEVGAFGLDSLPAPLAFRTHIQAIDQWRRTGRSVSAALPPPDGEDQAIVPRIAVAADLSAVLDIVLDGDPDPERRLYAEALAHDWLHDPDRLILVVESGGQIAGAAMLTLHQTLSGWHATLDDLVIGLEHRRRGFGAALVAAAARVASARGCSAIHFFAEAPADETESYLVAHGFASGAVLTRRIT